MRFLTLEVLPRGENGWGSTVLPFGRCVTSIFAKNGSGKTPLVQALVHSLGYPVTFRDDVSAKCAATRLVCQVGQDEVVLERKIDKEFLLNITTSDGSVVECFSERQFSDQLFEILNISAPELVGLNRLSIRPYLATVLPAFYLDQDIGYGAIYKAPANFIQDQFAESIRLLFGFGPKNSFSSRKDLLSARDELAALDQKIVFQQESIARLKNDVSTEETPETVDARLAQMHEQLRGLRGTVSVRDSADSALHELYSAKAQAIQRSRRELEALKMKVEGIELIRGEILAEADTLSLNEEARRVFTSFEEICTNENCCLFMNSAQSYAKNLLYLKDQIKDMERNAFAASTRISAIVTYVASQEAELVEIGSKISNTRERGDVSAIIDAVESLTREVVDLAKVRSHLQAVARENQLYLELLNRREDLHNRIATLSSTGERDLQFARFRQALKEEVVCWLDVLDTKNVSREINIGLDMRFDFGGEQLDAIKGSTKVRIVLAVHAALLKLYLSDSSRPFRFLILDTPRQHEIHAEDLIRYLQELKKTVKALDGQVVLSSTSFEFPFDDLDREWLPKFSGSLQSMYFGRVSDLL
jgi:hypothetical protein